MMSDSELYKDGGTITTSNVNKRNAELAQEYKRKTEAENAANMYGSAKEQGRNEAYLDVMQRLSQSGNQYTPIAEGSPMDLQMQENVDRGLSYKEPQEPGLLDAISGLLSASQPTVDPYQAQATKSADDMREDAYTSAFATAESMGDTSEENMNNLVIQELNKRGL